MACFITYNEHAFERAKEQGDKHRGSTYSFDQFCAVVYECAFIRVNQPTGLRVCMHLCCVALVYTYVSCASVAWVSAYANCSELSGVKSKPTKSL